METIDFFSDRYSSNKNKILLKEIKPVHIGHLNYRGNKEMI